jgi:hypothetical protein
MNKNTLFYIGLKPSLEYYNKDVDLELYNYQPSEWDAKAMTLDYW